MNLLVRTLLVDPARAWLKRYRFERLLAETVGVAAGWTQPEQAMAFALRALAAVRSALPEPPKKGAPDIVTLKSVQATELASLLPTLADHGEAALTLATSIASVDPRDATAFGLYLAVFWLAHQQTILALKSEAAPHVALHMSCRPRLHRAEESVGSFQSLPPHYLRHLLLVGNGSGFAFRYHDGILEVPAGDGYDQLPMKMACAFTMLAIACNPRCVIKLDDDHRAGNTRALRRLLDHFGRRRGAVQAGRLYFASGPSGHNRGWHYGKCPGHHANHRPLAFPTPASWASGEYGYLLNGAALRRFPWASLYYRDWLRDILYEDIAVGEIGARLGIRAEDTAMERAVSALPAY